MASAKVVITDSGGMQEETTALQIPCLTMRFNTERPITVELGTSKLVGNDVEQMRVDFRKIISGEWRTGDKVPLWDGKTSERIVGELWKVVVK